jgi:molecular chaperone DnaK (HSP70)
MTTLKEQRILAIDLGTSNSVIAYWDGAGPRIIRNRFNQATTPSLVWFDPRQNKLVVGSLARNQVGKKGQQLVARIKRKMGTGEQTYLGGVAYLPHEIAAAILQALKEEAERYFKEPVRNAVITVPANFPQEAIEATKRAGELAGLTVLALPEEPTAAALAYYHSARERGDRTWLVYDCGAGTTDISVVAVRDGDFKVLGISGDNYMAGSDFDKLLCDYIVREAGIALDMSREENQTALLRLRQEAEDIKIILSAETHTAILIEDFGSDMQGDPVMIDLTITRKEFEDLIRERVEGSIAHCHEALAEAKLTMDGIDDIIIVGGSGQIPLIAEVLEAQLGKSPRRDIDPLTCVAEGAAIEASLQKVTVQGETIAIEFPELKTLTSMGSQDLVGRIQSRNGISLHGAMVAIERADGGFSEQAALNDRGNFEFELPLLPNASNRFTLIVRSAQGEELGRKELRIEHRDQAPEVHQVEYRTPYAISIGLADNHTDVMVPENAQLPKKVTKVRYTTQDDQRELRVPIYEGKHPMADRNRHIGDVVVPDIPPGFPERTPVEVTIEVDKSRLLTVTVRHKAGQSKSAEIRPGWTTERSMEELQQEFKQVLGTVRAKTAGGSDENAGRVEQIAAEVEEAVKDGERGKVVSRIEMLKQQDDELSKKLPDPKDVAKFEELEELLLRVAYDEGPQIVPNLPRKVQDIVTKADSARQAGDRAGFEAALAELEALFREVQKKIIEQTSPEQMFALLAQSFEQEAAAAQHLAKELAQKGRPEHLRQVDQSIAKGRQAINMRSPQMLSFAGQELQGLVEQMERLLRTLGRITD